MRHDIKTCPVCADVLAEAKALADFDEAMADVKAGRVVPLDVALTTAPTTAGTTVHFSSSTPPGDPAQSMDVHCMVCAHRGDFSGERPCLKCDTSEGADRPSRWEAIATPLTKPDLRPELFEWVLTVFGPVPEGQAYLDRDHVDVLIAVVGPDPGLSHGHRWHAERRVINGLTWSDVARDCFVAGALTCTNPSHGDGVNLEDGDLPEALLKPCWLAGNIHRTEPAPPAEERRYGPDKLTVAEALALPQWAMSYVWPLDERHEVLARGVNRESACKDGRLVYRRTGPDPITWAECKALWKDGKINQQIPNGRWVFWGRAEAESHTQARWQAGELRRRPAATREPRPAASAGDGLLAFPCNNKGEGGWLLSFPDLMKVIARARTRNGHFIDVSEEDIESIVMALAEMGHIQIENTRAAPEPPANGGEG